jgi:hypothetical protein
MKDEEFSSSDLADSIVAQQKLLWSHLPLHEAADSKLFFKTDESGRLLLRTADNTIYLLADADHVSKRVRSRAAPK